MTDEEAQIKPCPQNVQRLVLLAAECLLSVHLFLPETIFSHFHIEPTHWILSSLRADMASYPQIHLPSPRHRVILITFAD